MIFFLSLALLVASQPDPPETASAWYEAGTRLLAEGDAAGAAAAFEAAHAGGWASPALYLQWSRAEAAAGGPARARLQAERAVRLAPDAALVQNARAEALRRLDLDPPPPAPLRRTAERLGATGIGWLLGLGLALSGAAGALAPWAAWEGRHRAWRRRLLLVAGVVGAGCVAAALALSAEHSGPRAIVVAAEGVALRDAPAGNALGRLPGGALVTPLTAEGEWRPPPSLF